MSASFAWTWPNHHERGGMTHLPAFMDKMRQANLPQVVLDTFAHYYDLVSTGATGIR